MNNNGFPLFIKNLPEADLPFAGLRGWLEQGETGQVLFNESDVELTVSEHKHGEQWGIVIDGKIVMTIGGATAAFVRGDSYHIPADTLHSAVIYPGFRAIDFFADKNRYQMRTASE